MNHLRVYIGKYIDQTDHFINPDHIVLGDSSRFNFNVEPGEVNLPVSSSYKFTLDNMDHEGGERYPLSFWESHSRTQAEGAVQPLQIYVEILVRHNTVFRGVVNSISYSAYNARCTVNCSDLLEFLRLSDKGILKSFEFDTVLMSELESGESTPFGTVNSLPDVRSIDGQTIRQTSLVFFLSDSGAPNIPNNSEISRHLGWDNLNYSTNRSIERSAWVQIEDITLLTRVRFLQRRQGQPGQSGNAIYIQVWHNASDPIIYGENDQRVEIIPRGQYLNRQGNKLERDPMDSYGTEEVTLILHEPDLGNGTNASISISETDLNRNFIFGVPYASQAGYVQITSASYSYFNVVQKTINAINREIDTIHSSTIGNNYFDTRFLLPKWRFAFWADIYMYGWLDANIAETITRIAHQTASYLYTGRDGNIRLHSRGSHQNVTDSAALRATQIEDFYWEPLSGENPQNGWGTYEAEVPNDIVEINNIVSETTEKIIVNSTGRILNPGLRNKRLQISNYRTHDLGVPDANDYIPSPVLRYSPGSPLWPNTQRINDFIPLAEQMMRDVAISLQYPTIMSRVRISFLKYQLSIGNYILDDDHNLWWINRLALDADNLTCDCEIQKIGTARRPDDASGILLEKYMVLERDVFEAEINATWGLRRAQDAELIFEPSENWESGAVAAGSNCIVDHQGHIRVYYQLRIPDGGKRAIAVLVSTDEGLTFQKVRRNLNPAFANDPNSNCIYVEPPTGFHADRVSGFSVFMDPRAPASHRYKAIGKWQNDGRTFVWHGSEEDEGLSFFNPTKIMDPFSGDNAPQNIQYDPKEGDWVSFGRNRGRDAQAGNPPTPYSGRRWPTAIRSNNWNSGFGSNPPSRIIDPSLVWGYGNNVDSSSFWRAISGSCGNRWVPVNPSQARLRPDIYSGNIMVYDNYYIGILPVYFKDDNRVPYRRPERITGAIYPVLAYSRNRFQNWVFPDQNESVFNLNSYRRVDTHNCTTAPGVSETGQLYSGATFARKNGTLFITALNRIRIHYDNHTTSSLPDFRGIYMNKMREDGFAGYANIAINSDALVITVPIQVPNSTDKMIVNALANGTVDVEITNTSNDVISGFSRDDFYTIRGDSVEFEARWLTRNINELRGQTVKFRFYFRFATLYSFKFMEDV